MITQSDRDAANKALDIAFRGDTSTIDDDMAQLFAEHRSELIAALIAAKQEMWLVARHQWTMADFKNWAVIQQIDAALEKADGKPRTEAAIAKVIP